jgi:3-oxoadipate enol-lactonase
MRVNAGDLQINCETYGDAGDWLVMCHGLGSGLQSMRRVAELYSDGYRVLIWDNRGLGDSDDAPAGSGYAIEDHARDLANLMDALGIEAAIVHGVSWGGIVAERFAIDYPEKVRALVVDSSSAEMNERAAQNWVTRGEMMVRDGPAAIRSAPGGLNEGQPAASPEVYAQMEALRINPQAYLETCKAIASLHEKPLNGELSKLNVPSVAIVGEHDQVAGVGGTVKLSRVIPGCKLVIVKDAGHGVSAHDPAALRREIDELAARIS